jgi:hypothetical protein
MGRSLVFVEQHSEVASKLFRLPQWMLLDLNGQLCGGRITHLAYRTDSQCLTAFPSGAQMRFLTYFGLALIFIGSAPSRAGDLCEAIALRDLPAVEAPAAILKKGEHHEQITQYRVNKKTGEAILCAHGGNCYPATVTENGKRVETLHLTNCKVGARDPFDDPDEVFYSVDIIRSKIPPAQLRVDDLDNRLLDLGLCSACAGNAAYLYFNKPTSRCAKLTGRALKGNREALAALRKIPDFCNAPN